MGYSFRLAARVLLYASSHRQDDAYHSLCYTSRGALAGTRNSSMGPPHEGSIRRPIAPWANALTTELHLVNGDNETVVKTKGSVLLSDDGGGCGWNVCWCCLHDRVGVAVDAGFLVRGGLDVVLGVHAWLKKCGSVGAVVVAVVVVVVVVADLLNTELEVNGFAGGNFGADVDCTFPS